MPARPGIVRLPPWVPAAAGVAIAAILAAQAVGWLALPRWLAPWEPPAAPGVEQRAERAARIWREAAGEIARARGVSADEALIGSDLSPLVTTLGAREAKRVAASPAWAPALAEQLHAAGIGPGDTVAASFSGSFPGLNLAVAAACEALDARLVAVSSVTASSFGATDPGFTWPEIEARLVGSGALRPVSAAVSAGGDGDRALDLDEEGRALAARIAADAARELGARLLEPSTFEEAVAARIAVFDAARGARRLAAFVNVGGTEASLGLSPAILRVRSGWLQPVVFDRSPGRGLVARMVERGVPVLHVLNVRELAVRWGVR